MDRRAVLVLATAGLTATRVAEASFPEVCGRFLAAEIGKRDRVTRIAVDG